MSVLSERRYNSAKFRKFADVCMVRTSDLKNFESLSTGTPESQQPTESQIIRICMEIYVYKIDKMVKMYKKQLFKYTYLMKSFVFVVFLLFPAL